MVDVRRTQGCAPAGEVGFVDLASLECRTEGARRGLNRTRLIEGRARLGRGGLQGARARFCSRVFFLCGTTTVGWRWHYCCRRWCSWRRLYAAVALPLPLSALVRLLCVLLLWLWV